MSSKLISKKKNISDLSSEDDAYRASKTPKNPQKENSKEMDSVEKKNSKKSMRDISSSEDENLNKRS